MDKPDKRAIRRIKLTNFLSFGPDSPELELENLNVLIGPNGSGKSNLIEAIALLRATPVPLVAGKASLSGVVTMGGGVDQWIFKGAGSKRASLLAEVDGYLGSDAQHFIAFGLEAQRFCITEERLGVAGLGVYFHNGSHGGRTWIRDLAGEERDLPPERISRNQSVLSQIRDPVEYPVLRKLSDVYENIWIWRDWTFGRGTVFRTPQSADMPSDRLEEDFSNLGLVLSDLQNSPKIKSEFQHYLSELYDGITDFHINIRNGYVDIFLHEGEMTVPATRLSDGTLRYLCLLAILCNPEPPPLICIEEPELGLHPDILPKLADLLIEASQRTQLIVTTHADVLVDAMTEQPESVVVCERRQGQTYMKRLSEPELKPWLRKYRLGELWSRGYIGANRW